MARSDQKPILIVEDEDDDVILFERALKKAGLSNPLQVVGNVTSAKQYLSAEGAFADRSRYPFPSVLVVDLRLPDGNGLELLRWVRSQSQFENLHCLVVTGDLRASILADCYAAGGNSFLRKPCSDQDLRSVADGFAQQWLPDAPANG